MRANATGCMHLGSSGVRIPIAPPPPSQQQPQLHVSSWRLVCQLGSASRNARRASLTGRCVSRPLCSSELGDLKSAHKPLGLFGFSCEGFVEVPTAP